MEIILAILVGVLYTTGIYMILLRSILKFIIGIMFIGNDTNLMIFLASGIVAGEPAFVNEVVNNPSEMTDPLPQAFILTSIVISFGIVVFALALKLKLFEITGTDDLDQLKKTDS